MRLLAFVLKSGLKQYFTAKAIWPDADVGFLDSDRYWGPLRKYNEVILVDSTSVSGVTFLRATRVIGTLFPEAKIRTAAYPRTEFARVDYPLPEPKLSRKRIVFVSGYSACGKSALARGLARALGALYVKWGKLVASACDVGKFGEKVPENPFHLPQLLAEKIRAAVERARKYVVIDGVKTVEQIVFLSYATLSPAIVTFVEASEKLRRKIAELRKNPDDAYFGERDRFFSRAFSSVRRLAYTVRTDSRKVPELFDVLGLKPEIKGTFNPFVTKENLLAEYVVTASRVPPSEVSPEVELHAGYAKRYGLEDTLAECVNMAATSVRLIDDILDEHDVRWSSEEQKILECPWRKWGILRTVFEAVKLASGAKRELREFPRYLRLMAAGVFRELELERSGRRPTPDDWLVSTLREAAFRAMIARVIGEDVEREVVKALYAQAKDDVEGAEKGGRENTDVRLNRPTYDRAVGGSYGWIKEADMHEIFERLDASRATRNVYTRLITARSSPGSLRL